MVNTLLKSVAIGLVVIILIVILFSAGVVDNCPLKHVGVVNDLKKYEETLDAELCEDLVNRIIELNDQCGIEIEIIDCG
jgi:hypothetical protein